MSVEKPTTWIQTSIGSLCNLINGRAFKPKEWRESGLPIIRIQNLNNPNATYNHFDGELADKHRIENGDLLFAWSGTPGTSFGAHVWYGETAALNQHIFKIEFIEDLIEKRFLRYAINQTLGELISGAHGGVGLRHVTKGKFEATAIAFPPLAEQKVIADKLDTLLVQVENTKARLESIPKILKRFRQSVLAAAVSGRLTDNGETNKKIWLLTRLSDLCTTAFDGPFGSKLKSSDYTDDGVGVVRLENIKHLRFDQSKETFISEEKYLTLEKNKLQKNDLLFSSFVDEEIRACLFPFETLRFINKADCFCLRTNQKKALPEFVLYLLTSQYSYAQIKEHVQGVTRPRVNLKILKSLEFPIPPKDEQTEIVRRVDQLFAYADRIEQQVNQALVRVNNLTQSILAKAFRGELTEQWRKDNPELINGENSAEALLERIKAERAAKAPAKRTRKKATA